MIKNYFLSALFVFFTTLAVGQAPTCPANTNPDMSYTWPTHSKWFYGMSKILSFGATGSGAGTNANLTGTVGWYNSYESVASACDENGNLVIATNGVDLWDAAGASVAVPGGRLLTGAEIPTGDAGSAVHGVMIVKHPLDVDNYYIFTGDDAISGQTSASKPVAATYGFNYYIYNKTSNSITAGPVRLGNYRSTEQIAATWHANGIDIWIVTHESIPLGSSKPTSNDTYNAYLLKCAGLETNPVKSNLGFKVTVGSDWQGYPDRSNERASLKFSWDGTKAAATHHRGNGDVSAITECVGIMDFNNLTGQFSNWTGINRNTVPYSNPYCCEFSPSSNRLFVSFQCDPWSAPTSSGRVEYFPVGGGAPTLVGSLSSTVDAGFIKLGGDGNMYVANFQLTPWARRDNLIRISAPDGAATWNATAIASGAGNVSYGLPSMFVPPRDWLEIQTPPAMTTCDLPYNFSTLWLCKGTDAENTPLYENAYSMVSGPAGGSINAITGVFTATDPGTYKIRFDICDIWDTLTFVVGTCGCEADVKNTTVNICQGQSILLDSLFIKGSGPGAWSIDSIPGGTGAIATLSETATDTMFNTAATTRPGKYKLKWTVSPNACDDSLYVIVNKTPVAAVNNDTICVGDVAATFTATADSTIVSYLWSANGTGVNPTTSGTTAGAYTVTVTDNHGCIDDATGTLKVNALPVAAVNNDTICAGDPAATFTATADTAITGYVWSGNGTGTASTTTGTTAGNYTVTITDKNGCKDDATGVLLVNALPEVTVNSATVCAGTSQVFTATVDSVVDTYAWSGQGTGTLQTTSGTTAGNYVVNVVDENGCAGTATGVLTVDPLRDATITSAADTMSFCILDPNPTVSVAEVGGTWDNAAVSMNGTTATIDLAALVAANGGADVTNQRLIYSIANPCGDADTIWISTRSQLDATITQVGPYCEDDPTVVNLSAVDEGATGALWSGTGITNTTTGTFSPSVAGAGTHTITYDIPGNCGDTKTIDIVVNPRADATITTSDTTICEYDQEFTVKTLVSGGTWAEILGTNTSGGFNATTGVFNPETSGGGVFRLEYSFGGNCPDRDTIVITVVDTIDIVITDPADICANANPINLVVNPTGGTWTGNGVNAAGTFTPSAALIGTQTLTYSTSTSSGAKVCPVSKSTTINVLPNADATLPRDVTKCNTDAAFSVATIGDAGGVYTASCGACIDAATGMFDPSVAGQGTHTVTYTIADPCGDSDQLIVTVEAAPTINITPVSDVCLGDASTVQLTATPAGGSWSYEGISNNTGLFNLPSSAGVTTATYMASSPNGCSATSTVDIEMLNNPPVVVEPTVVDACVVFTETFNDLTDYSNVNVSSSLWTFGNGLNSSALLTASTQYSVPGTYTVTLQNVYDNGCSNSGTTTVYARPIPVADFEWAPKKASVLDPNIQFTNTSQGAITYEWDFTEKGTPSTSTFENPYITFSSEEDDTVDVHLTVTNQYGCVHDTIKPVIIEDFFQVYIPNAFTPGDRADGLNDYFVPVCRNAAEEDYEFVVLDRWGLVIFKSTKVGEGWDGTVDGTFTGKSGKVAQVDVYVYKLKVKDKYTNKKHQYYGTVTLVK